MSITLLWPVTRWPDRHAAEVEAAGADVECVFVDRPGNVTDEQWGQADGIISSPDPLPSEEMDKIGNCRIFVTPKVGFDNIDLRKWGGQGIPVCNVPDYGTQDVADHAMGLLLSLMKGISRYDNRMRKAATPRDHWRAMDQPLALRLSEAKVGIVGLGRIGTAMTLRCKAFGMDVTFYDPYKPNGSDLALGIKRTDSLETLFAGSDIVSLHVPLTDETRNMINADILASAKPGLVLINAARGEVVDIDALHDAMKSGQVGGAGLDVLPEEPANPEKPLIAAWHGNEEWIADRLLITPHSAFYTPQSLYDMRTKGIHVALKYLRTGRLENCVNEEFLVNRR
ncbi:MAG: C-terminal binding protein [Pseudomonadales bacterium]|nr:C-terminal binding protein [Pseudomonadales bacterium]